VAAVAPKFRLSDRMTARESAVRPIEPTSIQLHGIRALSRVMHFDPRGFLVETLRHDDSAVRGDEFAMSYASVTLPGEFRDRDRWHVHKLQTDRFVVVLGEMILALYDARSDSPSRGRLEVIRMKGAPYAPPSRELKGDVETSLVPIPPGVYHCIGNLSPQPFLLVNFPTKLYDSHDEGRVPFREVPVDRLEGPFEWAKVEIDRSTP
jgi:dTDP-4-dehydrorhamnose 3,5-epimerase